MARIKIRVSRTRAVTLDSTCQGETLERRGTRGIRSRQEGAGLLRRHARDLINQVAQLPDPDGVSVIDARPIEPVMERPTGHSESIGDLLP